MPVFKTSYDTTMGKIFDLRKLDLTLKKMLITTFISSRTLRLPPNDGRKAIFITGMDTDETEVPPFIHPYLLKDKNVEYLATDLRSFNNTASKYASDREFETSVRNTTEYSLVKSRAMLNLMWLGPDILKIRARFAFAGNVFAAWLSQAITRAYALDFSDQARIMAVSLYYYHLLFETETRLSGKALEVAVVHTIKATKLPGAEIYKLFEEIGEISCIEDYCNEVKKHIESVRLNDFNLLMLLTLIENTWYGTNSKELLKVAVEHPPTWIAIVYATLTERTYRSSGLFKLIEVQSKRGNSDEFRMNYLELVRSVAVITESADNSNEELYVRPFEG